MAAAKHIRFFLQGKRFYFPGRTALKQQISRLIHIEGKKLGYLNYIFCNDRELMRINRQYLNHNDYTDIITFELSSPGAQVEAEVYISIDRVKANARSLGLPFIQELRRVMFHGALHLCGYGDKKPTEKQLMREREDFWLRKSSFT